MTPMWFAAPGPSGRTAVAATGAGSEPVEGVEYLGRTPELVAPSVGELDEHSGFDQRPEGPVGVLGGDPHLGGDQRGVDDRVAQKQVGDPPCRCVPAGADAPCQSWRMAWRSATSRRPLATAWNPAAANASTMAMRFSGSLKP